MKSEEIIEICKWKFTGIKVPTDNLVEDFHRLVKLDCRKKHTLNVCIHFYMYIQRLKKQKYCLVGLESTMGTTVLVKKINDTF